MTARKPQTKAEPTEIAEPSHEAEHEQGIVGEAKPTERQTAENIAAILADGYFDGQTAGATVNGNRLTITVPGPNGLVQTFHATVEPGVTEF